jgi:hypothetical protein
VDKIQHGVAIGVGADIKRGVGHVARVRIRNCTRALGVTREDSVLRQLLHGDRRSLLLESGTRGQIRTRVAAHADLPASVTAVPPDLVAVVAHEIAERITSSQVFNSDAIDFENFDAVPASPVHAGILVCSFEPGGAKKAASSTDLGFVSALDG